MSECTGRLGRRTCRCESLPLRVALLAALLAQDLAALLAQELAALLVAPAPLQPPPPPHRPCTGLAVQRSKEARTEDEVEADELEADEVAAAAPRRTRGALRWLPPPLTGVAERSATWL